MLKKVYELSSDLVLSLVLLGIITTAAVSVITLSPLTAEDKGYNKNVLGESTQKDTVSMQKGELQITSIAEEHAYFKVETDNSKGFVQKVAVGPMTKGDLSKNIFNIKNISQSSKKFLVSIYVPDQYKELGEYGIKFNDKEYLLVGEGKESTNFIEGNMATGKDYNFELVLKANQNINFPVDIQVTVNEIANEIDLGN